ncbi:Isoprenylcysteine carboxyl methyltransferase family-domain-containing protein [Scenedesmus sp. NREL 46B-D3]|nr:Isoprenylcysteine carboxyl methyltransferase family-domain-containing protein [Scenedesmus sp. NREL 46B-D3]
MWPLLVFAGSLAFFHASEFLLAATYMRDELSTRSLLISKAYIIAMSCGVLEYLLESALLPSLKQLHAVSYCGLALLVLGEFVRKAAMITAASNFTHDIRRTRQPGHVLVTRGIYRCVRHPGYMGWFLWSVGTQLLLVNPGCTLAFAYVSWRFFYDRIQYEEFYLRRFFGEQYLQYSDCTPSGIPFIA